MWLVGAQQAADARRAERYRAKAGGADPTMNAALDTLLRQAKDLGVPKDVVERNLKRATDAKQGDYQVTMEARGDGLPRWNTCTAMRGAGMV